MNQNRLIGDLQVALGDDGALYGVDTCLRAVQRAICAYSQYSPCLRRIGVATVADTVVAGATEIVVVGGLINAGMTVVVDSVGMFPETLTVSAVSYTENGPDPTGTVTITVASATAYSHNPGALVVPAPPLRPVLSVLSGQDTYALPADFIAVQKSSFDLAVGAKLTYRKGNGFYDATSMISNDLSGTGFGRSAGWGPSSTSGYPLVGNPFDNPNGGMPQPGCIAYRFYTSDTTYLRVMPIPAGSWDLDFDYYGCHTVQSVPSADGELILLYGRYAALSARANAIQESSALSGTVGDVTMGDVVTSVSRNVKQLRDLANDAKALFDDKLRFIPFGLSG